jgi:hypothetical protein
MILTIFLSANISLKATCYSLYGTDRVSLALDFIQDEINHATYQLRSAMADAMIS